MANILLEGFLQRIPDPRTAEWPLVDFNQAVIVSSVYALCVLVGPKLLRDVKKRELQALRVIYNGLMALLNLYIVVELLRQAALTTWFGPITQGEQGLGVSLLLPFYISPPPKTNTISQCCSLQMAKVLYIYYLSKAFEWIDTVCNTNSCC